MSNYTHMALMLLLSYKFSNFYNSGIYLLR